MTVEQGTELIAQTAAVLANLQALSYAFQVFFFLVGAVIIVAGLKYIVVGR